MSLISSVFLKNQAGDKKTGNFEVTAAGDSTEELYHYKSSFTSFSNTALS